MCLKHYKLDASAVINAILENNLAPSLKSIDQSLPFIPPESLKVSFLEFVNLIKHKYLLKLIFDS